MGKLSEIYSSYKKNLDSAQGEYENSIRDAAANTRVFYEKFFRELTVNMGLRLKNKNYRQMIVEDTERFFGKREINFVAVDGSCHKHVSNEYISFYGGAYGAKGVLSLSDTDTAVQYKRWEIEKDVSMVAFVPVPYNKMSEIDDLNDRERALRQFTVSEYDRVEMTSMHLPMMQLAEVFLAYNSATSSVLEHPDLILIDNSLSGMLGYTDFSPDKVGLVGCILSDGRTLKRHDVVVAQAHPFHAEMEIPSTKTFSQKFAVIRAVHDNHGNDNIDIDTITQMTKITNSKRIKKIIQRLERDGIVESDDSGSSVRVVVDPYLSWEQTKSMFQGICKSIFLDKRKNAMRYRTTPSGIQRWMSPDDVRFLISVGLRALIEECWAKKILLVGIAKDSASAYLTKNYLGVCHHFGMYSQLDDMQLGVLPPTDRVLCELLPYIHDDLYGPWGTIEFDSTFMTLRTAVRNGRVMFGGTFGGITRPERLFMRSIGQFYTRRHTESPLTGHAIFIDRITFPQWDLDAERLQIRDGQIGDIEPIIYSTTDSRNTGQHVTYFLIDVLTKNHFAEMIGYPDPLHKADQGAKSMRDSVKMLLDNSEIKFRSKPLVNTLREIRKSFRR